MKGLLGVKDFPAGCALVLDRARQVHSLGMRFSIDVIFCDRAGNVLHVSRSLAPGRVTRYVGSARYAVELPAGAADHVSTGDQLSLIRR
jgi:uncharacterized membrane protein (UPF0127 family)